MKDEVFLTFPVFFDRIKLWKFIVGDFQRVIDWGIMLSSLIILKKQRSDDFMTLIELIKESFQLSQKGDKHLLKLMVDNLMARKEQERGVQ